MLATAVKNLSSRTVMAMLQLMNVRGGVLIGVILPVVRREMSAEDLLMFMSMKK